MMFHAPPRTWTGLLPIRTPPKSRPGVPEIITAETGEHYTVADIDTTLWLEYGLKDGGWRRGDLQQLYYGTTSLSMKQIQQVMGSTRLSNKVKVDLVNLLYGRFIPAIDKAILTGTGFLVNGVTVYTGELPRFELLWKAKSEYMLGSDHGLLRRAVRREAITKAAAGLIREIFKLNTAEDVITKSELERIESHTTTINPRVETTLTTTDPVDFSIAVDGYIKLAVRRVIQPYELRTILEYLGVNTHYNIDDLIMLGVVDRHIQLVLQRNDAYLSRLLLNPQTQMTPEEAEAVISYFGTDNRIGFYTFARLCGYDKIHCTPAVMSFLIEKYNTSRLAGRRRGRTYIEEEEVEGDITLMKERMAAWAYDRERPGISGLTYMAYIAKNL